MSNEIASGWIVERQLKRGLSLEAYVKYQGEDVYLGQFALDTGCHKAQQEAFELLAQGKRPTPPPVPRVQIRNEGVIPRMLRDGTIVYDIDVTVNRERAVVSSFRTEAEALEARTTWLEELNKGNLSYRPAKRLLPKQQALGAELKMDPSPAPEIVFCDYAYRWYEARRELWASATLSENRSLVGRYVNPVLGKVAVRAITHHHLTALDDVMASQKLSELQRSKVRRLLIKILSSAVVDGLLPSNPATYDWCRTGTVAST